MGEYAPNDQRDVHDSAGADWREQEEQGEGAKSGDQQQATKAKTGDPRPEYDQYEVNQPDGLNKQSDAQMGYGNARDEDANMEQDVSSKGLGNSLGAPDVKSAQPGEISSNPARRAEADAERPLGKD